MTSGTFCTNILPFPAWRTAGGCGFAEMKALRFDARRLRREIE
jgi:hypothetical protein